MKRKHQLGVDHEKAAQKAHERAARRAQMSNLRDFSGQIVPEKTAVVGDDANVAGQMAKAADLLA